MNEKQIRTVNDLLYIIKELQNRYGDNTSSSGPPWYKYKSNLWFRGHAKTDWELKPKVERDDFCRIAKEAESSPISYEMSILNQFRTQGCHLIPEEMSNTDIYFLSQHNGLPTRLLDWSTNPLAALFFAVTNYTNKIGSIYAFYSRGEIVNYEENDIVYQNDKSVTKFINSIFERDWGIRSEHNKYPLRVIPNSQSGRMLQQGARFTLHYPDGLPLENQLEKIIFKYTIPSECKTIILKDLRTLGVHWASLFPDLEHLIKELKEQSGVK